MVSIVIIMEKDLIRETDLRELAYFAIEMEQVEKKIIKLRKRMYRACPKIFSIQVDKNQNSPPLK